MQKKTIEMILSPPVLTWRDRARRALHREAPPRMMITRVVAPPAVWEGRRHLEALVRTGGDEREEPAARALALAGPGRPESAT
jgi:hypothetical protein